MIAPSQIHRLATCLLFVSGATLFASDEDSSVSPQEALTRLKEGNERYTSSAVTGGKAVASRRAETAQTQHPFAIVLGCADSRTSPELVFDQNLGDLFVVRTAGNLVDEHALGSIEYAVEHLGARLIVVLGHERCGAVGAALASPTAPGNINSLVRDLQPAVQSATGGAGDPMDNTVKVNAKLMASKIRGDAANFGHSAKEVHVVAAVYDLDTGKVEWLAD